jgi:hypothetical protein
VIIVAGNGNTLSEFPMLELGMESIAKKDTQKCPFVVAWIVICFTYSKGGEYDLVYGQEICSGVTGYS